MSIDPEVNELKEIILDILARLDELEEQPACIVAEVEEKNGVLEYCVPVDPSDCSGI